MKLLTANTIAAEIANVHNKIRATQVSALVGLEDILNNPVILAEVESINLHQREVFFKDGSILFVLDTEAARKAGLTDYDYAYKSQDQQC